MKTVYENIVEKLYQEYSVHGFISEDRIFEVLEENNISLLDSDSIVDKLLSRGVIIRDDAIPEPDEDDDEYDKGHYDYETGIAEVYVKRLSSFAHSCTFGNGNLCTCR